MSVGDAVRIGRGAIAEHLAIDLGAAGLGVVEFFQDHHRRPFAEHKAVAVAVERARGLVRFVVAGGEAP